MSPLGLLRLALCCLAALAGGCQPDEPAAPAPIAAEPLAPAREAVVGQTIYVPVYSHIFFRDQGREIDLAVTLSVRNTDPERPVTVTGVRYHDSDGRLVRRYLDAPVALPPLASRAYVVEEADRTGGVGASFVVAWAAETAVSPPVAEAVMIGTAGSQGISFVSPGRVVERADVPRP